MTTYKDWDDAGKAGVNAREKADATPPEKPRWNGAAAAAEHEKRNFERRMREQANGPDLEPELKPGSFILFDDLETAPRKNWLVRDFLGEGDFNCSFGPPFSGKSCIVADRGAHIAGNRPWFGRPVECCSVLHVAAERAAVVKRRYAAFGKHHNILFLPLAVVSRRVDLRSNYNDAQLIVDYCKRLEDEKELRTGLVIIETVNRVLAGGDENSPKDMGALVDRFAFIQEKTGAAIDAVHHIPADGTQRLRGHGALLGACDATDRVERIGKLRACTVDMSNDGPEDERVVFDLKSVELYYDDETGISTTAPVVVPSDDGVVIAKPSEIRPTGTAKIALDILRDAIARDGQIPPASNFIPGQVHAVRDTLWRPLFYARAIEQGDTPAARKKAFQRACQKLQTLGLIGFNDGWVWLI